MAKTHSEPVSKANPSDLSPKVGVVMGSHSDLPTMQEAIKVLKEFKIGFDVDVVSAHRSPKLAYKYASEAEKKGYEVIIAGAGGAAALPGVIAGLTTLPVIGVPVAGQGLGGLDSLYSMVQMPGGVPVAITGMGAAGAKNAAILAVEILSLKEPSLKKKLLEYKEGLAMEVERRAREVKKRLAGEGEPD